MSTLSYPDADKLPLTPYLPPPNPTPTQKLHVTLTFATSLDSQISLSPGTQTVLSGPLSKAMTHYLRSCHSAILIGVGTAVADDPGLNCRLEGVTQQPRPVVVDPWGRWKVGEESRMIKAAGKGEGLAPFVIVGRGCEIEGGRRAVVERDGGKYIELPRGGDGRIAWRSILGALRGQGLTSVMIEGGGGVINELLRPENQGLIDSVIVTIAPTWLGKGGVVVSPERDRSGGLNVARLTDVKWHPLGEDVVLCGKFKAIGG